MENFLPFQRYFGKYSPNEVLKSCFMENIPPAYLKGKNLKIPNGKRT
jgi:hypothetical protein